MKGHCTLQNSKKMPKIIITSINVLLRTIGTLFRLNVLIITLIVFPLSSLPIQFNKYLFEYLSNAVGGTKWKHGPLIHRGLEYNLYNSVLLNDAANVPAKNFSAFWDLSELRTSWIAWEASQSNKTPWSVSPSLLNQPLCDLVIQFSLIST